MSCKEGCQYAKDVGMPEYHCGGKFCKMYDEHHQRIWAYTVWSVITIVVTVTVILCHVFR